MCGTKVGSVEAPREAHSSTPLFANSSANRFDRRCARILARVLDGCLYALLPSMFHGGQTLYVVVSLPTGSSGADGGRLNPGTSARCQPEERFVRRQPRYLMNPTARRDQYLTPLPRANVTPSHRRLGRSYFSRPAALPGSHWRNEASGLYLSPSVHLAGPEDSEAVLDHARFGKHGLTPRRTAIPIPSQGSHQGFSYLPSTTLASNMSCRPHGASWRSFGDERAVPEAW